MQKNEDYLDFKRYLDKQMEQYFATIFEDVRHERSLIFLLSFTDSDILSQFDNINENDIPILERLADLPPQIRDTAHQKMLINNHTDVNKGRVKG